MSNRLLPFELHNTAGTLTDSNQIRIDTSGFTGYLSGMNTDDVQKLAVQVDALMSGGVPGMVSANNVSVSQTLLNGLITGATNVQEALNRIDATGLGASPRTFTDSFFASYGVMGNQDVWYGGRQTVYLIGESTTNGNRVFELPDISELTLMFNDLVSRGLGEIFTITIEFDGGASSSVVRNSLTVRAPSVSALFDRNELPVTITRGAFVTFRITRTGSTINQWERVSVGQSRDPVGTFGEVVLQSTGWNNADNSFLPQTGSVQKGYAFPVFGSNPNDGTLRQGLLDSGVSDRVIYDGDYVVWTADTFTSWLNGGDWFVLSRDDLRRLTREQSNFLAETTEIDNRVTVAPINGLGSEGVVWISENPLAAAPFINPSTDPNNPRTGDNYSYVGGRENRDQSGLNFQFGQNRFNAYITVGVTPAFIAAQGVDNIRIFVLDDNQIVQTLNLATDFVLRADGDFTNSTYRHYTRATSFNYSFLNTIVVALTEVKRSFTLSTNVNTTQNVMNLTEPQLSQELQDKINQPLPDNSERFREIEPRLMTYENIQRQDPDIDALFLNSTGTDPVPSDLSGFNQVSAENPRFTGNNVALFVAVDIRNDATRHAFLLNNITTPSASVPLDNSHPQVSILESTQFNGATYFVYRVTGLTIGHVYEVDRVTIVQVLKEQQDILNLENRVSEIDAILEHPILDLPDGLTNVLENEVTVTEETNPVEVATDFNKQLAGASNTTQTVFRESNPNVPSGGIVNSKPINETAATPRARKKLIYLPEILNYVNGPILRANDGTTNRQLLTYENGFFNARQFVDAIPASTRESTLYPATATGVSGREIWQTVEALTFINGVPVPEADELFFTRNLPSSATTLTIQYRGHANGNPFGEAVTTLVGVGGSSPVSTSVTLDDGSEQATIGIDWRPNDPSIRVTVVERVRQGLPTINDIQVILSFTETRTVPGTPATTRDVRIESLHGGYQIFAIKPNSIGNLVLVGDNAEIELNQAYTTYFGTTEAGHIISNVPEAVFFDYQDFEPTASTITSLENQTVNPGLGLFSTQYNHETILDLDVTLRAPFIAASFTTVQRDALVAVNGMIIYNTTTNAFNFYENGTWVVK